MATVTGAGPAGATRDARVGSGTVLAVASIGAFLAFLDATVVNVAFPSIRASFGGASIGELSWVLNAYNIVLAATLILFGRMADLVGRRRLFALGVALFTLSSLLCAAAGSVWWLVAARSVQALGAAMLIPASLALVIQAFPLERRVHAVGLWGATAAAAAGLGPPIGGALVKWGDWRWAFLVNLPVGAAALVASRRWLVESRSPGRRRLPDLRGALLLALAMGLLTTAIVTGNDWGWTSAEVLLCAGGSVAAAVGFVQSSRVHPSPLVDRALMASRGFVVANAASAVAGLGFYAYLLTNVLWLQYIWHYDVFRTGLALVPGAVVAAVSAAVLGPLAERRGHLVVVVPGALVWASAYLWYAVAVDPSPSFLGHWLPGQVLSGLGVGATLPILGSAALSAVPGGRYAVASAVNSSVRQIGGVLGISFLVVLIGTPAPAGAADAFRRGWVFSAACFVLCAGVALLAAGSRDAAEQVDEGSGEASAALLSVPEMVTAAAVAVSRSLMHELGPEGRERVERSGERVHLHAGETLFEAGDPAGAAFSVLSGRVDVLTSDGRVRSLGAGDVIGELAMLTGGVRSATVRAHRDTMLLRIAPEALDQALDEHPAIARSLVRVLASQLASPAVRERQRPPVIVTVVGLHPGAPVAAVTDALRAGLARWLRVAVSGDVDAAGLERLEKTHDRVLLTVPLEADHAVGADAQAWSAAAIRQADVVVAVAAGGQQPGSSTLALAPGADVVLVGGNPSTDQVVAWSQLLDAWQVTTVDAPTTSALRPLVARLAGRSLGLVLAGGGARAFAHLGVLAALEEAAIPVDRVAGCSVGGVVAALHAAGMPALEAREQIYAEFVRGRPFSDYTVPRAALAKGQRRRRAMTRVFGDTMMESLPHQFRCVSTDLLAREVVVHRRGPLVPALMATTSLPGLFPPVKVDGRLLVDGGVLNNLPVDALTERPEGPLVAVNISMGGSGPARPTAGGPPRPLRTPALGETLLRTMLIGSGGAVESAQAAGAIVVTPAAMGVGLLEFHQLDTLVEAGLVAGRRLVAESGLTSLL
ncbi:MDR family MFS transporter/patatin-like phospholipase family protein [Pedococcus bigeumensis]|uniref:DHA2 family efflux MFS transporter permease subunit n=1 Tax=Pedococcus bigeumensis TaxID=433644 RepID=A0A502CY95_9MICO|nr:MDR family MFS transporter/patatin-like phospholipase family protein [Pedococcus bigeumensis]TPG17868.1 DHA2 family efflux MFS transporter permease subunit [Pedococcus bigeumensis]